MTRWDPDADDFVEDDDPEEDLELQHLRRRCEACGCDPCVCPDSEDFCTTCGNLEDECTCKLYPIDDMDANTQGDIA